jgi:molybdopterin-binding protein
MNVVYGEITEILSEGELSLVRILAGGQSFHSILIDTPATSTYLRNGHPVRLLFKETEVMIAKQDSLQISVRNQIRCRVAKITPGKLLCELTLDWPVLPIHQTGIAPFEPGAPLRSIITRAACEELGLKVNDPVIALIKTNEVSLSPHDRLATSMA